MQLLIPLLGGIVLSCLRMGTGTHPSFIEEKSNVFIFLNFIPSTKLLARLTFHIHLPGWRFNNFINTFLYVENKLSLIQITNFEFSYRADSDERNI